MFPVYDPYSALVYSAIASNVRDVYVAGECLVKEKKLVREDFAKIRNDLREKMERRSLVRWGIWYRCKNRSRSRNGSNSHKQRMQKAAWNL